MKNDLVFIKDALHFLNENKLLVSIEKVIPFYDDPQIIQFESTLNNTALNNSYHTFSEHIHASGYSFSSKPLALAKCFGESLERLSSYTFLKKKIIMKNLPQSLIAFLLNQNELQKFSGNIGYTYGFDVHNNKTVLIPAQLAYVTYHKFYTEAKITESNTNGAAGGFTHEEVLLSAIYEVVERDAFMTMYLGSFTPPLINVQLLKSRKIEKILNICKRYHLEPFIFNITNDLGIPTFMTILIDRTGYGPAVSVGLKTGRTSEELIIRSIEEAFVSRQWIRKEMLYGEKSDELAANSILSRGLYWSSLTRLKHLEYLLSQKPQTLLVQKMKGSISEELLQVLDIFKKKQIQIYYVDISLPSYKNLGYKVYKVIIPSLQPLYLYEKNKVINITRLKNVSNYYKQEQTINTIPHPLL